MQYDPNLLRHMDARALAAVHEAAGLRARELRAQAMDAFWSSLLRWVRGQLRAGRAGAAGAPRRPGACIS